MRREGTVCAKQRKLRKPKRAPATDLNEEDTHTRPTNEHATTGEQSKTNKTQTTELKTKEAAGLRKLMACGSVDPKQKRGYELLWAHPQRREAPPAKVEKQRKGKKDLLRSLRIL